MKQINWREIVEIVGAVSIVAALLLVALELRDGNQITRHIAETDAQFALFRLRRIRPHKYAEPLSMRLFTVDAEGQHNCDGQSQMQALHARH